MKRAETFQRYGMATAVLDVLETSAYLAITRDQVYRMVRAGELPHTRVGKAIRFRVQDLDAYLAQRTSQKWEKVDRRGRPAKAAVAERAAK